jgi:hypothetical protein
MIPAATVIGGATLCWDAAHFTLPAPSTEISLSRRIILFAPVL